MIDKETFKSCAQENSLDKKQLCHGLSMMDPEKNTIKKKILKFEDPPQQKKYEEPSR